MKKRKRIRAVGYDHFEVMFQCAEVRSRDDVACLSLEKAGELTDVLTRTSRPDYFVWHIKN